MIRHIDNTQRASEPSGLEQQGEAGVAVTGIRTNTQMKRTVLLAVLAMLFLNVPLIVGSVAPANAAANAPTDDTYADASRPDRVFGARNAMRADGSPLRVAYVKFVLEGSGTPESAALEIVVETNADDLTLHTVNDTQWTEETLNYANAPALDGEISTIVGARAGTSYQFDVSSIVTGDGTYSFAVTTSDNTAIRLGTKEGGKAAQLYVPAPASPSPFLVTRVGTEYTAASQTTASSYTGTLKTVVESAVFELGLFGGGTVTFDTGTFNLGGDWFEFDNINDIVFEGQGPSSTVITNNSSAATDTEPFDIVGANRLTLRDMTISANGALRSTSDALDFDDGNNITVERVHVTASRSRGIVFDGKAAGHMADGNSVIDCVIDGIPDDGIELLASNNNTISGCIITDVGGHGIQVNKASATAPQPNKQSNDNLITGNTINDSGRDGININSSDRNTITNNVVLNSADNVSNRDGVRIDSFNDVSCNDNEIEGNTITDDQPVKTQRYGINITSANCNATVIGVNDLAGNKVGEINDGGTNTIYDLPPDTEAPTVPAGVAANAASHFEVDVTWQASSDNVAVDSYTVYRDGGPVGTVDGATLSYRDATAEANTTYQYTVEAFDAAANPSGQSAPAQVTTPSPSSSITLVPTDDTYVDSTQTTRNFGTSSALRIDGTPEKDAYLKFDVAGVSGTIASATLRIYAASGSSIGFDLGGVADSSWLEGSLTYQNAPPIGASLGSSGPFSSGAYIEIDVTGYVTGNGAVSFGITTPHTTAIRFDSSEGANQPELVITQS
jgi:parallel beta-helix repeat protein